LATLAPFIDEQGLIRLSGRTEAAPLVYETKYPLLLHARDPMAEVLVPDTHQDLLHAGGSRALHTELSKFYWIPKVTTLLRRVAYKCVVCRRKFARPTTQIMAPLPFFRLPSAKLHPFEFAAVDVAGPYYIIEHKEMHKRWLLVIRCRTIGEILGREILGRAAKASRAACRKRNQFSRRGGIPARKGENRHVRSAEKTQHTISICSTQSTSLPRLVERVVGPLNRQ
jgi:hypothetical protein